MSTVMQLCDRCGENRSFLYFVDDEFICDRCWMNQSSTRDLIRKAQTAGLSVVVTELGGGK